MCVVESTVSMNRPQMFSLIPVGRPKISSPESHVSMVLLLSRKGTEMEHTVNEILGSSVVRISIFSNIACETVTYSNS